MSAVGLVASILLGLVFLVSGASKLAAGDVAYEPRLTEVAPGHLLSVPARVEHRFHSVTEDLLLLVFFAPAEGTAELEEQEKDWEHGGPEPTSEGEDGEDQKGVEGPGVGRSQSKARVVWPKVDRSGYLAAPGQSN